MPRLPAYSQGFFYETGVDGTTEVGSPPAGYLWILREALYTVGGFQAGSPSLSVQLSEAGPGWQLRDDLAAAQKIFIGAFTFQWSGRFVVPAGQTLWVNTNTSMTVYLGGYQLATVG